MKYIDILESDRGCPFCLISDSEIVVSNSVGYVTPALAPYGDLHALICSHDHRESVLDFSQEEYGEMQSLVRGVVERFYGLGAQEVSVLVRDSRSFDEVGRIGSTSGKTQKHYHIHVMGDVQITSVELANQGDSDVRTILSADQMKQRTQDYAV